MNTIYKIGSHRFTEAQLDMAALVVQSTDEGKDVEVRQKKDGEYAVYELNRKRAQ